MENNLNLTKEDICRVPENINFPNEEEKILAYWRKEDIFGNCLRQSKGKPRYTFYDGPPFATGLPHYGHILAGTIKDVVTRYAHQQGYHVERRFGWDCHGLPVEYEIDKTLGIKGPEDVAKMGIPKYNGECRKIVMRYAKEWEEIVSRMGRWIDFRNDYKTLYPWYMETIWWVFKQLYEKGLVYQGVKVMPYSTACATALSNFESGQNYKEIVDPAVIVSLKIENSPDNSRLLIWTTTPWTLPSNLACCVNPNMSYVKVKELKTGDIFILAESRLEYVFKTSSDYEILERFPGGDLANTRYEPVFPYYKDYGQRNNAFRVLVDSYVTQDSGTGIVHQAPYFGEDDFRVCLAAGVITKDGEIVCPVDDSGRFTEEVKDFVGQYVKDADKHIIALLKKQGNLFHASHVKHNYPFCWRSDSPLIYKAVPSWFIRVEHMSKNLLSCSSQTYWIPDFVKEKRFGNWLKEARDWAVSRNRYWGTPIPIWISPKRDEIVCIGSIKELEELSGRKVTDLHRESVDDIEIPSKYPGSPPLRRITQVFDCWFESGSMPFAQQHFPFENEKEFTNCFPADFIAEGIDQTRGWFYTLLVISTALFNKPPFKNLIANGLVLASDGQKMSKRKKNYPDPMEVVAKYGADALRLYLINSPVVRAENLRFKEEGVRDIVKDVFLPWYNAYRFLIQNVVRLEKEDQFEYFFDRTRYLDGIKTAAIMDTWIVSFKESLLEFVAQEMKAYRLYTVVPRLTKFIDHLTNWYVRLNRKRIKGEMGLSQCVQSIDTLFDILMSMVKMMAPFTPYLSEYIFQRLSLLDKALINGSVHYQSMPIANRSLIQKSIEVAVSRMQIVTELGRVIRERCTLPVKYPVQEIIIIHKDLKYLEDIEDLKDFILGELNVRKLTVSDDKERFGITMRAEPDHKTLGQRLKKNFKAVMAEIKQLTDDEIQKSLKDGMFNVLGHNIDTSEVRVIYIISDKLGQNLVAHSDNDVLVLLDVTENEELYEEGIAREIINRIQKLKKKAGLIPTDKVTIFYRVGIDDVVKKVAKTHRELIKNSVKSEFREFGVEIAEKTFLIEEEFEIKGALLKITICSEGKRLSPFVPWANIVLDENIQERYTMGKKGTILLKNVNNEFLKIDTLKYSVIQLFGLYQISNLTLHCNKIELKKASDAVGETIFVTVGKANTYMKRCVAGSNYPFTLFVNCEYKEQKFTFLLENPKGKLMNVDFNVDFLLKQVFPGVEKNEIQISYS